MTRALRWHFPGVERMVWCLAVARMSPMASRLGIALVLAALCLGGRAAYAQVAAQVAPVPYWSPGWPIGFGGNWAAGQSWNTYSATRVGDLSSMRYDLGNGWFAAAKGGDLGLGMNGISQNSMQFGYNFQKAGGLPFTVYGGLDTFKYNSGLGAPVAPFDTASGTLSTYRAHAGVQFQPVPDVSLSLGVGVTQQGR
jgi:hypothetical protein